MDQNGTNVYLPLSSASAEYFFPLLFSDTQVLYNTSEGTSLKPPNEPVWGCSEWDQFRAILSLYTYWEGSSDAFTSEYTCLESDDHLPLTDTV